MSLVCLGSACGGLAQDCLPDSPCGSGSVLFPEESPRTRIGDSAVGTGEDTRAATSMGAFSDAGAETGGVGEIAMAPDCKLGEQFRLSEQVQINALAGCEVVQGSLLITPSSALDLRPLQALRVVEGKLMISGPLDSTVVASLAGLENLRSVYALSLANLSVESLRPLRELRFIRPQNGSPGGNLSIEDCPALTSLAGLDALQEVASISIRFNDALETLAGLAFPRQLDSLLITSNAVLRSLGPQQPTTHIEGLWINRSPLSELNALQNLQFVNEITLSNLDPKLDLVGLAQLEEVGVLQLSDLEIESLAPLSSLRSVRRFQASDMPRLYNVDAILVPELSLLVLDGVTGEGFQLNGFPLESKLTDLDIRNSSLVEGPYLVDIETLQNIRITGNSLLKTLTGLRELVTISSLEIRNNDQLQQLDLTNLQQAGRLTISCNAALSSQWWEPLSEVKTAQLNLRGNLDSPEDCLQ